MTMAIAQTKTLKCGIVTSKLSRGSYLLHVWTALASNSLHDVVVCGSVRSVLLPRLYGRHATTNLMFAIRNIGLQELNVPITNQYSWNKKSVEGFKYMIQFLVTLQKRKLVVLVRILTYLDYRKGWVYDCNVLAFVCVCVSAILLVPSCSSYKLIKINQFIENNLLIN